VKPIEIIVVDTNPPERSDDILGIAKLCSAFPLVRVIRAPNYGFNLSLGINVGIKRTSECADYVMATCIDLIFPPATIENVLSIMAKDAIGFSYCGRMVKIREFPDDPWLHWNELLSFVEFNPPPNYSLGAIIVASREWWFKVHGYDEENYPFGCADADLSRRATADGLRTVVLSWENGQILHKPHGRTSIVGKINQVDGRIVVRNRNGWGEMPP
jgi:GT2 family glycosyltransferase